MRTTRRRPWSLIPPILPGFVALALCGGLQNAWSTPLTVNTSANQIGRVTATGNGLARSFFQYDPLGRITATEHRMDGNAYVQSTTFGYPQNPGSTSGPGMVPATFTFFDGELVQYGYDASGALVSIRSTPSGGTAQWIVTNVLRNARGLTVEVDYGNGLTSQRLYNDATDLRLHELITRLPGLGGTVQDYVYSFDPDGNVIGITDNFDPSLSATYAYDSADQLVAMTSNGTTRTYQYDGSGNLIAKEGRAQTYGAPGMGPHALATSGTAAYGYDANGNLQSSSSGLTIAWNAENMPVATNLNGALVHRKLFLGEKLWKRIDADGTTTLFLPNLRIESGQPHPRKFFGVFAERSPDGSLAYYHADHLGSSTVVSNSQQQVIHRIAYLPYGEDRGVAGGGFTPKYQFNFKEKESTATGFYDYGARIYNPATGRFLSPDKMLDEGPNRYAYVANNPLKYVDPTGHFFQDPLQKESIDLVSKTLKVTTTGYETLEKAGKDKLITVLTRMLRDKMISEEIGTTALKMLRRGILVAHVVDFLFNTDSVGGGVADRGIYFFGHFPDYLAGDPKAFRAKGARVFQARYLDVSEHRWLEEENQIFVRRAVREVFDNTAEIALQTDVWSIDRNTQYWWEVREMLSAGLVPYKRQMVPAASPEGKSVLDMWKKDPNSIPWVAR